MTTDPTSSDRPSDPRDEGPSRRRPSPGPRERLDFDAYQDRALETAVFPDIGGERALYPALGLADEAGEVLGKIKKLYRDRGGEVTPEFRRELEKELGDVYWYLAVLADAFGLRSSEVAAGNLRKLADRAQRGVIRGEGDDR